MPPGRTGFCSHGKEQTGADMLGKDRREEVIQCLIIIHLWYVQVCSKYQTTPSSKDHRSSCIWIPVNGHKGCAEIQIPSRYLCPLCECRLPPCCGDPLAAMCARCTQLWQTCFALCPSWHRTQNGRALGRNLRNMAAVIYTESRSLQSHSQRSLVEANSSVVKTVTDQF